MEQLKAGGRGTSCGCSIGRRELGAGAENGVNAMGHSRGTRCVGVCMHQSVPLSSVPVCSAKCPGSPLHGPDDPHHCSHVLVPTQVPGLQLQAKRNSTGCCHGIAGRGGLNAATLVRLVGLQRQRGQQSQEYSYIIRSAATRSSMKLQPPCCGHGWGFSPAGFSFKALWSQTVG